MSKDEKKSPNECELCGDIGNDGPLLLRARCHHHHGSDWNGTTPLDCGARTMKRNQNIESCPWGCGEERASPGTVDPWKYHDLECSEKLLRDDLETVFREARAYQRQVWFKLVKKIKGI